MKLVKVLLFSSILLSGCSTDSDDSEDQAEVNTGVFIDSPVINIGFKTATRQGVTNASGEFSYLAGETVTFFIGDLEFPPVTAAAVITPLTIANTEDTSSPTVVNISRLLQTLDKDGDPDNGLEITEAAKSAATAVDVTIDKGDFQNLTEIINLINNGGQDTITTMLIDEIDAIRHLEESLSLPSDTSFDMTTKTATSEIISSHCPGSPGGWTYTFTATEMTLTGSDSWDDFCNLLAGESITLVMTDLVSDFDIPFNCPAYPVCTVDDFNKTISDIDGDGRSFTSTYSFDVETNVLVYIKAVEGVTYTETITIQ